MGKIKVNSSIDSIQKESKQAGKDDNVGMEKTFQPKYPFPILADLSEMNTYHSRAMNLKARVTTQLGYSIVDDDKPERKPDEEYDRIKKLMDESIDELFNIQLDDEIFGNGFVEIIRNNKGDVGELKHIPGVECSLVRKDNERCLKQKVNEKEAYFVPFLSKRKTTNKEKLNEYGHLKNYCPTNRFYGIPQYIAALATINLDRSAIEYNVRKFEGDCIPDVVISVTGAELDKEAEEKINKFFRTNFKGLEGVGKSLIITNAEKDGEIKIDKLNEEVKEASYRLLRQDNKEEILVAHEVPPILLGVQSSGRLGQGLEVRDQMKNFNEFVVLPRQRKLAKLLNEIILNGMQIQGWKIKFNQFEFVDAKENADFYQKMVTTVDPSGESILDANEARQEMGYKPKETKNKKPIEKSEKTMSAILSGLQIIRKNIEAVN